MRDVELIVVLALDDVVSESRVVHLAPVEEAVLNMPVEDASDFNLNGEEGHLLHSDGLGAILVAPEGPLAVGAGAGVVELGGEIAVSAVRKQPGVGERVELAVYHHGCLRCGAVSAGWEFASYKGCTGARYDVHCPQHCQRNDDCFHKARAKPLLCRLLTFENEVWLRQRL